MQRQRDDRDCGAHPAATRPLQPTHGCITLQRSLDNLPSFDTCGWFAREAGTTALVAEMLPGDDATSLPQTVSLKLTTEA